MTILKKEKDLKINNLVFYLKELKKKGKVKPKQVQGRK